jgi:hypothetical protein
MESKMKVQVSMVIQSHLSEAMNCTEESQRNIHIAFAKYLIHNFSLEDRIDAYEVFGKFYKEHKQILDLF